MGLGKDEAIAHDACVWEARAEVQKFMLMVELVSRSSGGEPDANALAVAVADHFELWRGDDMPQWLMDSAEWAVEQADEMEAKEEKEKNNGR